MTELNNVEDVAVLPIQEEIAGTGARRDITRINTWLDELIPPQDRILWTKGAGNLEIYERVLEDDQVKSTVQQRITGLLSREWEVLPGDERKSSQKAADFIKEILETCDWDDINDKALHGVFYGFTLAECLWMRDGEYITLDDTKGGIRVRNRRRFAFDDQMRPRLLTWEDYLLGEELPPRKFWYFCSGADNHDDPYGRALASWLYWPVFFKRGGLKKWLIFLEKFAQPSAVGKYAPGTSQADQAKLLEITRAIAEQTGLILPEGMIIELLEAKRSGTADYKTLQDQMNAAISKVVLSQTMTTDSGSSYAQAYVHDGVRKDVVKADADLINKSFNRQVVRWLMDFNAEKFRGAAYPMVWRRIEDEPDLKPQSERDKLLFDMGFRPTIEYVQETYGEGFVDSQAPGEDEGGETEKPPLYAGLGVGGTQALLDFVNNTTLPQEKAVQVLVQVFGLSEEQARSMLPEEREKPEPPPMVPGQPTPNPSQEGNEEPTPRSGEGEPTPSPSQEGNEEPTPSPSQEGTEAAMAGRPDTVELFVARLQEQAAPEFARWFDHIRELMGQSKDLQEFREKLAEGYPALDGDRLSQVMTEALFSGRLAGFYEAQEGE